MAELTEFTSVQSCISELNERGLAVLEGMTEARFKALIDGLGTIFKHPDSDEDGLTRITPRKEGSLSGDGFTLLGLGMHTDRALIDCPPSILVTYLHSPPESGGDATFCDMRPILQSLNKQFGPKLALNIRSARDGKDWPLLFSDRGRTRVRYRDDRTGWPSGPQEQIDFVRSMIQSNVFRMSLKQGHGYAVANDLYLHGREPFIGRDRVVARALLNVRRASQIRLPEFP